MKFRSIINQFSLKNHKKNHKKPKFYLKKASNSPFAAKISTEIPRKTGILWCALPFSIAKSRKSAEFLPIFAVFDAFWVVFDAFWVIFDILGPFLADFGVFLAVFRLKMGEFGAFSRENDAQREPKSSDSEPQTELFFWRFFRCFWCFGGVF
jgi:hypothetical protein